MPLTHEPRAVAPDPNTNALWILSYSTLLKFDTTPRLVQIFDLRSLLGEFTDATLLQVNPHDASLWVGGGKSLLHLRSDGSVMSQWQSSDAIQATALDFDESLWVLTQRELLNLSASAKVLFTLHLDGLFSAPRYLALDRIGSRVYVGDSTRTLQFDLKNISKPPISIDLAQGNVDSGDRGTTGPQGISAVGVHPTFGTLWVVASGNLLLYDRNANFLKRIDLSTYGASDVNGLAFDPVNLSLWLGGTRTLTQFRGNGEYMGRLALSSDLTAFGAAPFKLLPYLSLLAPADGGVTNDFMPSIRYSVGGDCTGSICYPDADYSSSLNLDVRLNNKAIGLRLNRSTTEASFTPIARLPEGFNQLTAQATDRYGHASRTVQNQFTVRTGNPVTPPNPISIISVPAPAVAPAPAASAQVTASAVVPNSGAPSSASSASVKTASAPKDQIPDSIGNKKRIAQALGQIPLSFEMNRGQSHEHVKFLTRSSGHAVFFTHGEAVAVLKNPKHLRRHAGSLRAANERDDLEATAASGNLGTVAGASQSESVGGPESAVFRMKLVDAISMPRVEGLEPLATKSNYLIGNDPKKWITDVPHYAKIKYHDVYPGIDQVFYGKDGMLEYDLIVRPGANPSAIKLTFEGAESARLNEQGDLILQTALGPVTHRKPFSYQDIGGRRHTIESRYVVYGNRDVGIEVKDYIRSRPLVIDPTIVYSTYIGGSEVQSGYAIAVDKNGSAYVTGLVSSTDFPVVNPIQGTIGGGPVAGMDVFISKLAPDGKSLIYSTYLGGNNEEFFRGGAGFAVDIDGNAYVAGSTQSPDFPTMNALQATLAGPSDGFVAKLNAAGNALLYSTYLGGQGDEFLGGLAADAQGNAYVGGWTTSSNFPVINAFMSTRPASASGFVSKISSSGGLEYSTYLGGNTVTQLHRVAVDSAGSAYVTGITYASDFPTKNSIADRVCPGIFVTKFEPSGAALAYSTCVAGPASAGNSNGIAVDSAGNAYIAGQTSSAAFPVVNAYQPTFRANSGYFHAFVTMLNAAGNTIQYSTYLGGSGATQSFARAIATDGRGNVYVTGSTNAPDFPIVNSLPDANPILTQNSMVFVAKLDPTATAASDTLVYSTALGGTNSYQHGYGISVDAAANAYVTGYTLATDFPVVDPIKGTNPSATAQVFVTKISSGTLPATTTSLSASASSVIVGNAVTFVASVAGNTPTGTVAFIDRGTVMATVNLLGGAATYTTAALIPGVHSVTARYSGDTSNEGSISAPVSVAVNAYPTVSIISPADESFFIAPATINLVARADVAGGSVSKVEFYRGRNLVGTVTSSPYVFSETDVRQGRFSITAKATSAAGLVTTSAPVTIAVRNAPALSVQGLTDGEIIADDSVTVTGTVKAPVNSSVIVNGILGTIGPDGRFFVNNVPLVPGANTLTIILTTPDGVSTTQTIQVTSSAQAPFVFSASPTEGFAPLTVNFTLTNRANAAYARIELSCLGDRAITRTVLAPSLELGACTYAAPGLYKARARVINTQNRVIYTGYQGIKVGSIGSQDAMLRDVYYSMLAQLKVRNISGALNYVTAGVYDKYNADFRALDAAGSTNLATVVSQLGFIADGRIGDGYAEYLVVRDVNGVPVGFLVYLIRGEDGIWRMEGM